MANVSASDHLGRQFVTLYRGVQTHPKNLKPEGIGIHWTTSRDVAEGAALGVYPEVNFENSDAVPSHGSILEAKVPKEAIVKRGTKEHRDLASMHEIGPYSLEKEKTLRPGTNVEATVHHIKYSPTKGPSTKTRSKKLKGTA